MSYIADLYIMLPCIRKSGTEIKPQYLGLKTIAESEENEKKSTIESFIDEINNTAQREFTGDLGKDIRRQPLHRIQFVDEPNDGGNPETYKPQEGFIVLSQYKDTDFCLLTIGARYVQKETMTHWMAQASLGKLQLKCKGTGEQLGLSDWMERYGVEPTGKAFFAACMNDIPQEEKPYILSGEAYYKGTSTYQIRPEALGASLTENHAQYESYDAFLSPCTVAMKLRNFIQYEERLKTECLLLFIMELTILKITAVNSANNDVLDAFKDGRLEPKDILDVSVCFSKSLPLWDIQHFRRQTVQAFASRIETAFQVSVCVAEYEKNRTHLEQVISVRNLIATEKETKAINALATILAVLQVAPLLFTLTLFLLDGGTIRTIYLLALLPSVVIVLTILLLMRKKKRKKRI